MLDEPLEGLAPVICDMLMDAFTQLAASGAMTILFVEQRLDSALAFAEDVIILERGRIVWSGTSAELRTQGEVLERYIGVGGLH
jgi:branched-chain amino acid transport system ATP-binding protein